MPSAARKQSRPQRMAPSRSHGSIRSSAAAAGVVAEAKRQVLRSVRHRRPFRPPEVLVVADDGANSEYVVGELLAQAEGTSVARLAVVSESRPLLEAVAQLLDTLDLRRWSAEPPSARRSKTNCRLIAMHQSREELFDVIERFAPAILCLQVRDASAYLPRVTARGNGLSSAT